MVIGRLPQMIRPPFAGYCAGCKPDAARKKIVPPQVQEGFTGGMGADRSRFPFERSNLMNNADLAAQIADGTGQSKADAKKMVDAVFAAVADAAAKGEEVSISGFGKFKVKESAAREGRNPATGETIQIAASKKLGFTPAKAVKDKLNG
jgi:DNA-binding protein HU-beta